MLLQTAPLAHPSELVVEAEPLQVEERIGELRITSASVYPNPFGWTTVVDYTLSATAQVEISVWNIYGQIVHTLDKGVRDSGRHILRWSPDGNVPSGLYYVLIKSENGVEKFLKVELSR